MICRKCGHQWFIEEIPFPKDIDCPSCGSPIFKDNRYVGAITAELHERGETKCRICGRTLTAPKSVARGVGPRCWAALRRKEAQEANPIPDCYGAFGSEECIIDDCSFKASCETEETKRFEKAREAEVQ